MSFLVGLSVAVISSRHLPCPLVVQQENRCLTVFWKLLIWQQGETLDNSFVLTDRVEAIIICVGVERDLVTHLQSTLQGVEHCALAPLVGSSSRHPPSPLPRNGISTLPVGTFGVIRTQDKIFMLRWIEATGLIFTFFDAIWTWQELNI
ncbi:unnamed protein product [Protopolystoma xenopodis]|uniref:Uncharacterized protein n=1 Tax=Protopolystoma xenopodis TaxID=117903 RepID=A0A3S5CKZ4_9PLAT|nr:unnamed protein product [Protopolystoma xenopodis]